MYRWVVAFLLHALVISCVYATDMVKQYDITEAILHKNDMNLPIPTQQQKHVILIIELTTLQKDILKNITPLTIQEKDTKPLQQTHKYLMLQNFTTSKTQNINTQFGTLALKQKMDSKDSYIQIPNNMPLKSAILLFHNERMYLIGFDNVYEVSAINEVLPQDLKPTNIMQDTTYEISSWRYFLVLGIMIAILIALYVIKLRQNKGTENSSIVLEQAKILDSKNKIALIKYGDKRYLIGLNPNGITLLDTLQCDTQIEQASTHSPHKDTKEQSFMQMFLKRQ